MYSSELSFCFNPYRIMVVSIGILLTIYESFATEVRNGQIYSFLMNQTNSKAEYQQRISISILVLVVILVVLFIQIRIKVDYWKKRQQVLPFAQNLDHNENENFGEYNKGTIFFVLTLAVMSGIIVFLKLILVQNDNPNFHLRRLKVMVGGNAVLFNVMPLVLILRNKNITDHVLKFFGLTSTPSHVINLSPVNDPNNNFPEANNVYVIEEIPEVQQPPLNENHSETSVANMSTDIHQPHVNQNISEPNLQLNSSSLPNVDC